MMTDGEKIVLGALVGIGVYVIGQLLSKFFIEPLYELRKAIGEVLLTCHFTPLQFAPPSGGQMNAPKRQKRLY